MRRAGRFRSRSAPWTIWAALNVAGAALIALPDSDNRVISFSGTHGPAAVDLAGSLLLLAGWLVLDAWIWHGRHGLERLGIRRLLRLFVAPAMAGAALTVWSISTDSGWWWLLGAVLMGAVQLAAALVAGRNAPGTEGGGRTRAA